MHTLLAERIARLGSTTTTTWRRVNVRETEAATEEAISDLCAWGLLEVQIVAAVEMGDLKMPKVRYVGGGAWWQLLEKELGRLVPATWIGKDGKPKENLLKRGNVVAIRLTADGQDYNRAVENGTWKKWIDTRPKKIRTYLRCDGIDKQNEIKRLPPLSDREQQIAELIREKGPMLGKAICRETGIEQSSLTKQVIPILKKRGLQNRRGVGYYFS